MVICLDNICSIVDNAALCDFSHLIRKQFQDAQCRRGFSGSGLSYDSQRLAFVQRQTSAVDRVHHRFIGVVLYVEIFNFQ